MSPPSAFSPSCRQNSGPVTRSWTPGTRGGLVPSCLPEPRSQAYPLLCLCPSVHGHPSHPFNTHTWLRPREFLSPSRKGKLDVPTHAGGFGAELRLWLSHLLSLMQSSCLPGSRDAVFWLHLELWSVLKLRWGMEGLHWHLSSLSPWGQLALSRFLSCVTCALCPLPSCHLYQWALASNPPLVLPGGDAASLTFPKCLLHSNCLALCPSISSSALVSGPTYFPNSLSPWLPLCLSVPT